VSLHIIHPTALSLSLSREREGREATRRIPDDASSADRSP
jgi:hypothetical protein